MGFLSGFFVSKDSCHAGVKAQAAFAAAFLLFLVMSRPYAYAHLQIVEGFTALLVVAALVAASLMTEGSSGSRVGLGPRRDSELERPLVAATTSLPVLPLPVAPPRMIR